MILYDLSTLSKRKKTREGYLLAPAKVARTGVQDYDAALDFAKDELPAHIDQKPGIVVRLLRPEAEVFSDQALKSVVNKPITDGHPSEDVTAENVKDLQVGFSRENVKRDGDTIAVDLLFQVKDAIEKIENEGVDQISLGYATDVVWQSGEDPDHGLYDGIQTNILVNHIALVKAGRAGPDVRLSDSQNDKGKKEIEKMATRMIDGITIEVTDQAGEAIDKLQNDAKASQDKIDSLTAELNDSKKETEKLTGELDAEKAKALDVSAVDSLVEGRIALIDKAKGIAPDLEVKGLKDTEIRKAAIEAAKPGEFDLNNKSDEYIEAVFDTLSQTSPGESAAINDDLKGLDKGLVSKVDESRSKMRENRNK